MYSICTREYAVDSSVGRASDCRSDGPWFDSGSADFCARKHAHALLGEKAGGAARREDTMLRPLENMSSIV